MSVCNSFRGVVPPLRRSDTARVEREDAIISVKSHLGGVQVRRTIHTTIDYWLDELLVVARQRGDRSGEIAQCRAEIHAATRAAPTPAPKRAPLDLQHEAACVRAVQDIAARLGLSIVHEGSEIRPDAASYVKPSELAAWLPGRAVPEPQRLQEIRARVFALEEALRPFAVSDEDAPNPELARKAREALGARLHDGSEKP